MSKLEGKSEKISLISYARNEQWKLLSMCLNYPHYYSHNERDDNQNTVLHILAQKKLCENTLHFIAHLKESININERNAEGKTPLHVAIQHNQLETAKKLIEYGAGINLPNKYGHSALYYAALGGNTKMVQLLYQCGCDLNYKDKRGENVLHHAARQNHKGLIVFFITKQIDINALNIYGQTPLEVAIKARNSEVAIVLICYKANAKLCNIQREGSLLHKSVKMGLFHVAKALMKTISIASLDTELRTPLHIAVEEGHLNIVRLFLKKGANINLPDSDGYTSLHLAVQKGHLEIINVFITNAQHQRGDSKDRVELTKEQQLIDLHKLDYYMVTNAGDNILHLLAASNMDQELKMNVFYVLRKLNLKKLVVKMNKDFRTPLHFAYQCFCRPLVTAFINLGADVEEIDKFGKKPKDYCTLPHGGRIRVIKKESFKRSRTCL